MQGTRGASPLVFQNNFNQFLDVREYCPQEYNSMKSKFFTDPVHLRWLSESPSREPNFPRYQRVPNYLRIPVVERERNAQEKALLLGGIRLMQTERPPEMKLPAPSVVKDHAMYQARNKFQEANPHIGYRFPAHYLPTQSPTSPRKGVMTNTMVTGSTMASPGQGGPTGGTIDSFYSTR